jgi:EAL domain-containing protein (putative c-di-GMP-specific phosphodiesterase class I)
MGVSGRQSMGEEALIRWNHPVLGLLMPDSFIPIAEGSGLIVPIGEWVIDAACRHAAATAGTNGALISVNLSPRQLNAPNLLGVVERALANHQIEKGRLCLEITEQCLMDENGGAQKTLSGLKNLGVQIVIDDFGIGYSSLRYLKRLGPGIIKIDQSFIHDVIKTPEDRAVVRAVIAMAHSLDIAVVAEGVEREDQRAYLSSEGCDMVQGYLYPAKPLTPGPEPGEPVLMTH